MCTRCAHVILRYQDEATETHAYPNGSTCSYVDNLFFEPRKTRTHARRLLRVCLLGRACAGDPHAHVNRHVSSHASPHVGDKRRSAQARTVFTSDVVASRRTAGGAALPGRRTASTGLKDPRSHRLALGDASRAARHRGAPQSINACHVDTPTRVFTGDYSSEDSQLTETTKRAVGVLLHVCPPPPRRAGVDQCAAGAGARGVADAMRASSRPAWGTRHECSVKRSTEKSVSAPA